MIGPSALRVLAMLTALGAVQLLLGSPMTPPRLAGVGICALIALLSWWGANAGVRVALFGVSLPATPAVIAALAGAGYGYLAIMIVGLGGPLPSDLTAFASMTGQLLPWAIVPALMFGAAWPAGSWRWGLLLGWGLVAFSALFTGAAAVLPYEHDSYDALMSDVNTLVEPLILFASMVLAATAASFLRGALPSSQRS